MEKLKSYITPRNLLIFNLILIILFFLFSCDADEEDDFFDPIAGIEDFISSLPEYVPVPDNNEMTLDKINLGRQLFWDPILSGNQDVACATCHHPDKGYADALDLSIGVGGIGLGQQRSGIILAQRNAHTIVNSAFNGITISNQVDPLDAPMFWDNRAMSLEAQAILPLLSKEEMRGTNISEGDLYGVIINRLNTIPEYKQAFLSAFGTDDITVERIGRAIASFERTLIATDSPFDRYMRGNTSAMTQQQINGMNAFVNVGCAECHSGPMFSDYLLHTLAVPDNPKLNETDPSTGTYAFRTPTLRNLSLTAPYMHNGMHGSLNEVMNFYEEVSEDDNEIINLNLSINDIDPLARDLNMDDDVTDAIIAFMEALNDPNFDRTIPATVPSGLPVGGDIND